MSKVKVYELAKELDKSSKELVEFLREKNIEVKSHMSTLEENEAELVRKASFNIAGFAGALRRR